MAICNVKERSQLGKGIVLAPERYDRRREALSAIASSIVLGMLVLPLRKTVNPNGNGAEPRDFLVLDTCDAQEGIIIARRRPAPLSSLRSAKKIVPARSVLISRLRPYLRQVAFVDDALNSRHKDVAIACSTEFFVLTPRDQRSIAFLVPFLLSEPVQEVLAASQEGGHHPRFDEYALLGLPVPRAWTDQRDEVSAQVELAISDFRKARVTVERLIVDAEAAMKAG